MGFGARETLFGSSGSSNGGSVSGNGGGTGEPNCITGVLRKSSFFGGSSLIGLSRAGAGVFGSGGGGCVL